MKNKPFIEVSNNIICPNTTLKLCTYTFRVPNLGQTGLNLETTTEVTIYEKAQITTHVSGEGENTGGGDNKQNMVK